MSGGAYRMPEPWQAPLHDEFCLDVEYGWHDGRGVFFPPLGAAWHAQYHRRMTTANGEYSEGKR